MDTEAWRDRIYLALNWDKYASKGHVWRHFWLSHWRWGSGSQGCYKPLTMGVKALCHRDVSSPNCKSAQAKTSSSCRLELLVLLCVFQVVFICVCIYSWLHWVFIAACGLSLVAISESYSRVAVHRLLIAVASLLVCFRSCSTGAQQLRHMGSDALWHAESSWTRDGTRVPRTGRQILDHRTTREVQLVCVLSSLTFLHYQHSNRSEK